MMGSRFSLALGMLLVLVSGRAGAAEPSVLVERHFFVVSKTAPDGSPNAKPGVEIVTLPTAPAAMTLRVVPLDGSDGKAMATGNSGVVHGPPPKTPHHPTVENALGPAKPLYKGGGHPCGSCGEPNAFSSLLEGVPPSGAAAKLDTVASVIIIQCTPGKRNKPKSGEAKAPCRFCQKMLPELKDPSGKGMDERIGLPAGGKSAADLQADCKSSGGCKGK